MITCSTNREKTTISDVPVEIITWSDGSTTVEVFYLHCERDAFQRIVEEHYGRPVNMRDSCGYYWAADLSPPNDEVAATTHTLKTQMVYTDDGTPYLTNVRIYLGDIVRSRREDDSFNYVGIVVDLKPDQPRYLVVEWQKFNDPTENRSMRFTELMDDIARQNHASPPIKPPDYRAFVERRAAEVYKEGEP